MLKRYIPTYHAKSIYDVPASFFVELGVKTILVDLDNTLDSYRSLSPRKEAYDLRGSLLAHGIELIIVSNNRGKRVKPYADKLGVRYVNSIGKPFKRGVLKAIKDLSLDKEKVIMVGDQTVTDICAANLAGIKCMLTDKIVKEDQPTTHFNRLFDRPIRRSLKKKNLLKEVGK